MPEICASAQRECKGSPLAKKRTATPVTKMGIYLCRSPPEKCLGDNTTVCACFLKHLTCRDGRSDESVLERRAVRTLNTEYPTALGTFFKLERALPLVEDVDVRTFDLSREFSITVVHSFLLW